MKSNIYRFQRIIQIFTDSFRARVLCVYTREDHVSDDLQIQSHKLRGLLLYSVDTIPCYNWPLRPASNASSSWLLGAPIPVGRCLRLSSCSVMNLKWACGHEPAITQWGHAFISLPGRLDIEPLLCWNFRILQHFAYRDRYGAALSCRIRRVFRVQSYVLL